MRGFMGFLKNSTLAIATIAIAVTVTPAISAVTTLNRPHAAAKKSQNKSPDKSQDLVATNGSSEPIQLPDTGAQNDSWSCGPNSAARILRYYGHDVNYATVRAATDKKLFLPQKFRNPLDNALSHKTRSDPGSLGYFLRLWIWFNRLAIENSRGLCRVVTRYILLRVV
jgi:hypothetical protein